MESATTSITVNVVDIQDPPPTFSASIYYADLDEGTYSNVHITTNNLGYRFLLSMLQYLPLRVRAFF